MESDWAGSLWIDGREIDDRLFNNTTWTFNSMYRKLEGQTYEAALVFADQVIALFRTGHQLKFPQVLCQAGSSKYGRHRQRRSGYNQVLHTEWYNRAERQSRT
jgi:hypothetical protein